MSDLISRQAMLDGIDKLIKIHFDRTVVLYKARKVAEDLPSAQPEIIRCKDCKYYQTEQCYMHIERLWELKPDDYCSQGERDE